MRVVADTPSPPTPDRIGHFVTNHLPWLVLASLWFLLVKQLWLEWSTDDDYSYGYAVPILALYLFARRCADRPAPDISGALRSEGALFALLAVPTVLLLPLRIVQESAPEWHYVSWCMAGSIICVTLGLIEYRAGWPWVKHFAFPVAFILTAVHWPAGIENPIISRLTKIDTGAAVYFLTWMGVPAVQNGNVIEAAGNLIGVSEACSGIRSLQITVMISLFFGEFHRFPAIRRLVLFLMVGAVALMCNLGRNFFLVWLSAHGGNARMEKWHDTVGLCVLAVALATFWGIATWMDAGRFRPFPASRLQTSGSDALLPWPAGFITALAAWLILTEIGTELWYRSHESSLPAKPAWSVNWPENVPGFKELAISPISRALLKYTTGRQATWRDFNDRSWSVFFFQWAPGRTSAILARMHRPETCLPSVGCRLIRGDPPRVVNVHGITIVFHAYLFEQGGKPLHVWWALWDGGANRAARVSSEGANDPAYILRTALSGQRNLGQQVLEIALAGPENDEDANAALEGLLPELIKKS